MSRIQQLDRTYQSNLHETELIGRDEDKRRLKLRLLALRDENALLKDKVHQKDTQYRELVVQHEDVRTQLRRMGESSRAQDAKLKKQTIELGNLQVRRIALNAVSTC